MSSGACKVYYCDMQSRLKPLQKGKGFTSNDAAEDIVRTAAVRMAPDIGLSAETNSSGDGRENADTFLNVLEKPFGTWSERQIQWVIEYLGRFTEPPL